MANFKVGQDIEILPSPMPPEERERLEKAVSIGRKGHQPSRVDQRQHQTVSHKATVEEVRKGVNGTSYLVRVFLEGRPNGVPRVYTEAKAKALFKAL